VIPPIFEKIDEIRENLVEMQWTKFGTIEFWNTEIRPVLPNYRLTSPTNHRFFPKFILAIPGRILAKTDRILPKIGQWKEKNHGKQRHDIY
jgi:hypothetical protein